MSQEASPRSVDECVDMFAELVMIELCHINMAIFIKWQHLGATMIVVAFLRLLHDAVGVPSPIRWWFVVIPAVLFVAFHCALYAVDQSRIHRLRASLGDRTAIALLRCRTLAAPTRADCLWYLGWAVRESGAEIARTVADPAAQRVALARVACRLWLTTTILEQIGGLPP